jgi:uncharacterized membrane protein
MEQVAGGPVPSETIRFLSKLKRGIRSNSLPLFFAAAYFAAISTLSVLRYYAFTDAWDFGGFVQSFSNASHGGFFLQTIDAFFAKGFPQTQVISFMGLHFSPVLFLIVPVYAAFPYP